jgi:hypothetical protein
MNLLCKLLGHKIVKKGYGNMYGTGVKIVCIRCGYIIKDFNKKESVNE